MTTHEWATVMFITYLWAVWLSLAVATLFTNWVSRRHS